jgi:hypothetical protein
MLNEIVYEVEGKKEKLKQKDKRHDEEDDDAGFLPNCSLFQSEWNVSAIAFNTTGAGLALFDVDEVSSMSSPAPVVKDQFNRAPAKPVVGAAVPSVR